MSNNTPRAITLSETAIELGLNIKTVLLRVHDGTIPAFRVGRAYRVRRVDLDALIQRNAVHPANLPAPLDSAR